MTVRSLAEIAYERWMEEPGVGAAYAGDTDVRDGFIAGYIARCSMTIQEIIGQCIRDSERWFPDKAFNMPFLALCLGGEVGEFQNKVKKVERGTHTYGELKKGMEEEAIDTFIYLCNIFAVLGIDVEEHYDTKRAINESRFRDWQASSGS